MKKSLRCLVTGAGAPGIRGTLYALRQNSDNVDVFILGVDIKEDVVGRYLTDAFSVIPAPEDPAYTDALIALVNKFEIDIVIPQTTREIEILSLKRALLRSKNIPVLVSKSSAIKTANNKWALLKEFDKLELPIPKYHYARSISDVEKFARKLGYPDKPVVVKPPVSNGMRGLRILKEKPWDADRYFSEKPSGVEISLDHFKQIFEGADTEPELLVSEYLPGPEYSVDVFRGKNGKVAIPRYRKVIRSGISFVNEIEYREDMINYSLQAADAIDLEYVFGFQFKLDEQGTPKILESNPRIQGTMVASNFAGANIIWTAVKDLLGWDYQISQEQLKKASFYRFWGGLGIKDGGIYEI